MSTDTKVKYVLGLVAGTLLGMFGKRTHKVNVNDLKRAEFKTSTQRLGIRFTEKLRDVLRFRWLKNRVS